MAGNYFGLMNSWKILSLIFAASFLIQGAFAAEISSSPISDAMHVNINTANGAGYYIKFDGGGLNALHLTTSSSDPYGQLTTSSQKSGFFYISDTGGRGFFNDIILMVALRKPYGEEESLPDNLNIKIKSSGYRWTPTGVLNQPPAEEDITYISGAVDQVFTLNSISYGPQAWKPAGNNDPLNYPIYGDQDMGNDEEFYIFFVDLKVGNLGDNSCLAELSDNGMVKVEYTIENLDSGMVAFNAYGWCAENQANQGEGISWTNALTGSSPSGYVVDLVDYSGGEGGSASSGMITYGDDAGASDYWKPKVGNLNLSSSPTGAMIFIDGIYSGQTNWSFTDMPAGNYLVHLELEEYENTDPKWLEVRNGYVTEEHFNLTPGKGSCFVSSVPEGADIFVDGTDTLWHTNSIVHGISSGNHTISVYRGGYGELSANVSIKMGEISTVTFSFEEKSEGNLNNEVFPGETRLQKPLNVDESANGKIPDTIRPENDLPSEKGPIESFISMFINLLFKSENPGVSPSYVKSLNKSEINENISSSLAPLDYPETDNITCTTAPVGAVGRLYVTSYPADLYITIDGKATDYKTPNMFYGLKEGYHEISVKTLGESPECAKKEVWVSSVEDSLVHLKPGANEEKIMVTVESKDFRDLNFMISGKMPEYTFPHKVSVYRTGSFISVYEGGKFYSYYVDSDYEDSVLKISRTDNFGIISVYTKPEGARVLVDGQNTGLITPCNVGNISGGSHIVGVSKDGYCPQEKEIFLVNTKDTVDYELRFVIEEYPYGNLQVDSTPHGAMIYLREAYTGMKTPYTFSHLPIGTYGIEIVYNRTVYDTSSVTIEPWRKNPLIEYNVTLEI